MIATLRARFLLFNIRGLFALRDPAGQSFALRYPGGRKVRRQCSSAYVKHMHINIGALDLHYIQYLIQSSYIYKCGLLIL